MRLLGILVVGIFLPACYGYNYSRCIGISADHCSEQDLQPYPECLRESVAVCREIRDQE